MNKAAFISSLEEGQLASRIGRKKKSTNGQLFSRTEFIISLRVATSGCASPVLETVFRLRLRRLVVSAVSWIV